MLFVLTMAVFSIIVSFSFSFTYINLFATFTHLVVHCLIDVVSFCLSITNFIDDHRSSLFFASSSSLILFSPSLQYPFQDEFLRSVQFVSFKIRLCNSIITDKSCTSEGIGHDRVWSNAH